MMTNTTVSFNFHKTKIIFSPFFHFNYSNYEDFSRDSFDDRRPPRDSFDSFDRRPRGQSPTYRYAPY